MLKRDNQNSQPKIKGPLVFDENKWNNIPECIISFFNILNEKIVEIESNHVLFKTKQEQNFTRQNQVINECKSIAEETQLNFNLTNQTLNTNLKEVKNKCENQNTMMRIKMEEEIDKINKRIDDISRGVNMKIEDNNETLALIKKEADETKDMFKQAMEEQKNEERVINIVTSSQKISEFVSSNIGIQDQLKQVKGQVRQEALAALENIFGNDKESNSKNGKNVGFIEQFENKTKESIKQELKLVQETIEKQQIASNDLILNIDKQIKNLQNQIEQISQITRKYEKERNNIDFVKLKQKYDQLEQQLLNYNSNFEKVQENMDLISNAMSHKLNDKIKQRSVTPTQFVRSSGQESNFSSKLNDLPSFSSNKLSEQQEQQDNGKQIPTQNSTIKDDMQQQQQQEEVTLEDKLQALKQRIDFLEIQFNQMKIDNKDENSEDDMNTRKSNQNEASKNILHKPWLTGQEVILKEGDNLAIKVFQKSQQINRKQKQFSNMYQNPQVLAKKYRNSILGQETDGLKNNNQNKDIGVRNNSHSKIQEVQHNPHNMTAYYKQNFAFDSSPEKSKKNSFSNANSQNEFQFTNDLIKSQLDNFSNRVKTQGDNQTKNEHNLLENQKNYNSQGEIDTKINHSNNNYLPPAPRSRNSKTFHSGANTAITSNISYINQSADQTNLPSNLNSVPQTNTNQFSMGQNIMNFQPQKATNQNDSPLNSYKIAKNVMKSTKIKTFRISQGVSFDAINLNKF